MTAAAPSWLELESLLDVPHVVDYDEQIRVVRERRADNLELIRAMRGKTVDAQSSASYMHSIALCRQEIDLCERWLVDRDEPFEAAE